MDGKVGSRKSWLKWQVVQLFNVSTLTSFTIGSKRKSRGQLENNLAWQFSILFGIRHDLFVCCGARFSFKTWLVMDNLVWHKKWWSKKLLCSNGLSSRIQRYPLAQTKHGWNLSLNLVWFRKKRKSYRMVNLVASHVVAQRARLKPYTFHFVDTIASTGSSQRSVAQVCLVPMDR